MTACLGAHAGADGGLIIAGTGSAGIALVDGQTTIVGGRGFLLGDDGAAARIGADAARAALRAFDQLEPMSGLSREILDHFGGDPLAMTRWALTAKPRDYGAFAPLALNAAERGEDGALPYRRRRRASDRGAGSRGRSARGAAHRHRRRPGGANPADACPPNSPRACCAPLFDPADGAVLLAGGVLPSSQTGARAK